MLNDKCSKCRTENPGPVVSRSGTQPGGFLKRVPDEWTLIMPSIMAQDTDLDYAREKAEGLLPVDIEDRDRRVRAVMNVIVFTEFDPVEALRSIPTSGFGGRLLCPVCWALVEADLDPLDRVELFGEVEGGYSRVKPTQVLGSDSVPD